MRSGGLRPPSQPLQECTNARHSCSARLRYGTVTGANRFRGSLAAAVTSIMNKISAIKQYRDTAEEIRGLAWRTKSEEVREDLLILAERYERLAAYVEERQKKHMPLSSPEGSCKLYQHSCASRHGYSALSLAAAEPRGGR